MDQHENCREIRKYLIVNDTKLVILADTTKSGPRARSSKTSEKKLKSITSNLVVLGKNTKITSKKVK